MAEFIAVGLDGSQRSWKAFREALEQAKHKEARLHVVSVQEPVHASFNPTEILAAEKTSRDNLHKVQIEARVQAEKAGVEIESALVQGHPVEAMVDYVKKHDIGLLVIGDTGHSSVLGALLGTMSEKIVRSVPCSVLVVR